MWSQLREQKLTADDLPAVHFQPLSGAPRQRVSIQRAVECSESAAPVLPDNETDIAFLPVTELSALIRHRKISSVELTQIYLKPMHLLLSLA